MEYQFRLHGILLLVGDGPSGIVRIRDRLESAVSGLLGMPTHYSVGLACSEEAGVDPSALYRLADTRLYDDKRRGRDRTVLVDETSAPVMVDPPAADPSPVDPSPVDVPSVRDLSAGDPVAPDPLAGDPVAPDRLAGDPVAPDQLAGEPLEGARAAADAPARDRPTIAPDMGKAPEGRYEVTPGDEANRIELRLRRVDAIIWAKVSHLPGGGLNVEVAARSDDRSWRERIMSELQAEAGGSVSLQVLDFDVAGPQPGLIERVPRVKVESVRQRLQYSPGNDPVAGIEVQLSHGGRRGSGFSWDSAPTAAVKATMAALADLGLSVPYEIESVTRLGFSSSAPVLAVLRLLGSGDSRMGVARRPEAIDAAARAVLDAANRDIERELEAMVVVAHGPGERVPVL